jgi:hypothetical protein
MTIESIMGLKGHDDYYLTTLATHPSDMSQDIVQTVRKLTQANYVEHNRNMRQLSDSLEFDDYDEEGYYTGYENFIEDEIEYSVDEYTDKNTLDMSLLIQAQPLTENGEPFDANNITQYDVSLEIRYWCKKNNCYYVVDTKYCDPYDCPIIMNIGGDDHGKLYDRRGEDVFEYQVDIEHPYMVKMKDIVQQASERGKRGKEKYIRKKQYRQECIDRINDERTFAKSKGIYHLYKKINAYLPYILGFSEYKLRFAKNTLKKSNEIIRDIDKKLEGLKITPDKEKTAFYIQFRAYIEKVNSNINEWLQTTHSCVFEITRNHTKNVACKEIRNLITSYI